MIPDEREYEVVGEITEDCQWLWLPHYKAYQRIFQHFQDKQLEIVIRIKRDKRSDAQNRYFWAVVVKCIQQWLLESKGEQHKPASVYAWIKVELLGVQMKVVKVMGKELIDVQDDISFSRMNTKEFSDTVELIRGKMAIRGCDIPPPTKTNRLHHFLGK